MSDKTQIKTPDERMIEFCYSSLGFSFTPLDGKAPKYKAWARAPHETLSMSLCWARTTNIGVRTGSNSVCPVTGRHLIVFDLDSYKPQYDVARVKALNLRLWPTVTAATGNGGYHLFYWLPFGMQAGNTNGTILPAVDTRATGGQVVFPGSIHPDTNRRYQWMQGRDPMSIELAELPPILINLIIR